MNITTQSQTMSSKEIAELTGKRHGDVIRDIRAMLKALGDDAEVRHVKKQVDSRGYTLEMLLSRYHTEVLVTGYDVKRRAAVIKRWYELETGAAEPVGQAVCVPQTMAEALRLAADQAEEIERQQAVIAESKPKVEFVDRYVESATGDMSFRQVCKILGAKEKDFRAFLSDKGIMYRQGKTWMAYSTHIDEGRFTTKAGSAENGHAFTATKFTAKGVEWIAKRWGGEQALAMVKGR